MSIPGGKPCVPLGFWGMLVLIVAVETTVVRHESWYMDITASNWRFGRWAASTQAPACDILCLGSSRVQFGAVPRVLEERTGRRAYNLALCNGRLVSSYFLLKRALEAGARPSTLVIDTNDPPVSRDPKGEPSPILADNVRNWPELLSLGECRQLAREAGEPEFFAKMFAARALPSYKARFELRRFLKNAARRHRVPPWFESVTHRRNWEINRGAFVLPIRNQAHETHALPAASGPTARFDWDHFRSDRLSELYLKRLLTLARAYQIKVFFVMAPIHPRSDRSFRERGLYDFATEVARKAQEIAPDVVVLDARLSGYPARTFSDSLHLNVVGATALSTDVAEVLARHRADPEQVNGWVSLPSYRERAVPAASEDLDQTRTALLNVLRK